MSERMTDERLAEIERAVFDVEGWPVDCSEELVLALKAEREKLRAVGELPGKWRKQPHYNGDMGMNLRYHGNQACADELEALLK